MLECLKKIGLRESHINIIESLHEGTNSTYMCANTVTKDLQIKKELKRDCALSMLVFNMTIKLLYNSSVLYVMCADDMAIVANSKKYC